jgi:hypothetical protein
LGAIQAQKHPGFFHLFISRYSIDNDLNIDSIDRSIDYIPSG